MKYICLGYFDERKWEAMPERGQHAFMDDCFAYDDLLRKKGHIVGGEALQSARSAVTLRWKNGKVSITDGPYAETKEQLGGFGVFEASDLNNAIQLMSKHPAVKGGPVDGVAGLDGEWNPAPATPYTGRSRRRRVVCGVGSSRDNDGNHRQAQLRRGG